MVRRGRRLVRVYESRRTCIGWDFDPRILPAGYNKYFSLEVDPFSGWIFDANAYVGLVPCKADTVIQLCPKIPIQNLTYLLLKSGQLNRSLQVPFKQTVPYSVADDDLEGFFEAFVQQFLRQLDVVKSKGLIRFDEIAFIESPSVRGKIMSSKLPRSFPRSFGLKLPQRTKIRELDNPFNRVIIRCLKELAQSQLLLVDLKDILIRLDYFEIASTGWADDKDLALVEEALYRRKIPSNRLYYADALNLALWILQSSGITVGKEQNVEFRPMLIDMASVFEKYLYSICRFFVQGSDFLVNPGEEVSIQFYEDASWGRLYLFPDIVFRKGGSYCHIIDSKYKGKPTAQDHYQMWAYLEAYDVDRGTFITLVNPDNPTPRGPRVFKRGERQIFEFKFDLSNIQQSEEEFELLLKECLVG